MSYFKISHFHSNHSDVSILLPSYRNSRDFDANEILSLAKEASFAISSAHNVALSLCLFLQTCSAFELLRMRNSFSPRLRKFESEFTILGGLLMRMNTNKRISGFIVVSLILINSWGLAGLFVIVPASKFHFHHSSLCLELSEHLEHQSFQSRYRKTVCPLKLFVCQE